MINNKINKTYLNVKYSEKDEAKKFGAKWDPNLKKWYAPNNEKVLLEKWGLKNKIKPVENVEEYKSVEEIKPIEVV